MTVRVTNGNIIVNGKVNHYRLLSCFHRQQIDGQSKVKLESLNGYITIRGKIVSSFGYSLLGNYVDRMDNARLYLNQLPVYRLGARSMDSAKYECL